MNIEWIILLIMVLCAVLNITYFKVRIQKPRPSRQKAIDAREQIFSSRDFDLEKRFDGRTD